MTKVEQQRILTTLVDHLDHDTTVDAGGVMRVPMSDFTCPDLFAQEQEMCFRQTPLCLGLSSELPGPNTYWSVMFDTVPLLLVRDGHGQFRAYINICRHRGSQLVPEGHGDKTYFACPFHAWTYGNDGCLKSVYKEHHYGQVMKSDLSLMELPAAELYGTLWVRLTPGASIDEATCFGGLQEEMASWDLATYPPAGTQVFDARMNWKLAIDSYGEMYHFDVLHATTAAKEAPGNVQTFDPFGRNLRMAIATNKLNLLRLLMPDIGRWPFRQGAITGYFLYPNTYIRVDEFGIQFIQLFPLNSSVSHSRTRHTWYIDPRVQQYFLEHHLDYDPVLTRYREAVLQEDYPMMENIQRNAESGGLHEMVLGRNEISLQHIHNARRQGLDREILPIEDS